MVDTKYGVYKKYGGYKGKYGGYRGTQKGCLIFNI
jgi:hypothetical protein